MATSRKYNAESITKETLILAKEFGFTKNQCIQIKSDVADYITLVQARGKWDDTADLWGWWNQLATAEVPAAEAAGSDVTVSPPTYRSRGEAFFEFGSCKDQISKPVGIISAEKLKMMALIRSRVDPDPGRQTHSLPQPFSKSTYFTFFPVVSDPSLRTSICPTAGIQITRTGLVRQHLLPLIYHFPHSSQLGHFLQTRGGRGGN
jgi:hypothetical protein